MEYPRMFRKSKGGYKLTPKEIEKIKLMFSQGFTKASIARKFKVSWDTVWYHLDATRRESRIANAMKNLRGLPKEIIRKRRKIHKRNKLSVQAKEWMIYKNPNAKFRRVEMTNEEYLKRVLSSNP